MLFYKETLKIYFINISNDFPLKLIGITFKFQKEVTES